MIETTIPVCCDTHGTAWPPPLYVVILLAQPRPPPLCQQHTAWMKTLWLDKQEVVWLLAWQPWLSWALWWQAWIHNSRTLDHQPDLSWLNPFTAHWPNLSRVMLHNGCCTGEPRWYFIVKIVTVTSFTKLDNTNTQNTNMDNLTVFTSTGSCNWQSVKKLY